MTHPLGILTSAKRDKWRAGGVLSGLRDRMYAMMCNEKVVYEDDIDDHGGGVSLRMYLAAARAFSSPDPDVHMRLAFRFFDVDRDGCVGAAELASGFAVLHSLYEGEHKAGDAKR